MTDLSYKQGRFYRIPLMFYHLSQGGALTYFAVYVRDKVGPRVNAQTSTAPSEFNDSNFSVVNDYLFTWGGACFLFACHEFFTLGFRRQSTSRHINADLCLSLVVIGIFPISFGCYSAIHAHRWYEHFETITGPDQRSLVRHCRALFGILVVNTAITAFALVLVPIAIYAYVTISRYLRKVIKRRGRCDEGSSKMTGWVPLSPEIEPQDQRPDTADRDKVIVITLDKPREARIPRGWKYFGYRTNGSA